MKQPLKKPAALLLSLLMLLTALFPAAGESVGGSAQKPQTVSWLVIDVSKWNPEGQIDWDRLKDDGVEAAILRVGGRGYAEEKSLYLDDMFPTHFKAAQAAGLHVGAYFFSYAMNEKMAVEEAELTLRVLRENGCEPDMPVFIDVEDYGYDHQHERNGRDANTKVVNAFCDTIREAGFYPGIYTGKWFAETCFNPEAFEDKAVWIAQYADKCGFAGTFDLWQFTDKSYVSPEYDDMTKLSAVSGNVDVSICYVDFPALIRADKSEPLDGHVPEKSWTVSVPATCKEDGVRVRRCADCGAVLASEAIPRGNHTPGCVYVYINNTANRAGKTVIGLNRMHAETEENFETLYLNTYLLKGGTKLTCCKDCKIVLSAEYVFPDCTHKNTEVKQTEATCTAQGVQETVCTDCGNVLRAAVTGVAAHRDGESRFVTDDCEAGGMNAVFCEACGAEIRAAYAPARAHTFQRTALPVAPTFHTGGEGIYTCTVCGKEETRALPPLPLGDLDRSGKTEAADARIALRIAVSLDPVPDDEGLELGDADLDEKISAEDARLILRIAVGLEDPDEVIERFTALRAAEKEAAEQTTEPVEETTQPDSENTQPDAETAQPDAETAEPTTAETQSQREPTAA